MKNAINHKEALVISSIYFFCGFVFLGKFNVAGINSWFSILLAVPVSVFLIFLYEKCAGFFLRSKVFIFFMCFPALMIFLFYNYLVTQFVSSCILTSSPIWIISGFLLVFSACFGLFGLLPIGRFCRVTFGFLLALFVLLVLLPTPTINLFYVDTVLDFSPSTHPILVRLGVYMPALEVAALFFTVIYFIKGMLLVNLFKLSDCREFSHFRAASKGILLSAPLISVSLFLCVLLLGPDLYTLLNYPTYYPLSLMESGDYIQHFEILFLIIYVFTELVHLGVLFLYLRISFQALAKRKADALSRSA